jgi:galactose mutarotase-like enzyme
VATGHLPPSLNGDVMPNFTHQKSFDHFELHTLKDDSGTLLEVVPERGGIISRFEVGGKPVFYLDRETLNDKSKNVRGGNPILFPICGPLVDNKYEIEGRSYSMKQHGFARNLPWTVADVKTDPDSASIKIHLESGPESREQYPFDFSVDFTYRLTANSLRIDQTYENRSSTPMPFYAGFHPYFTAPKKDAVNLTVAATKFNDFLSGETRPAERVINFEAGPELNGDFRYVSEKRVSFTNFGQPYSIEIEFGEQFKHVVIWALKDKPFICVEPWMGFNRALNAGESVTDLPPGEKMTTFTTFKVVKL